MSESRNKSLAGAMELKRVCSNILGAKDLHFLENSPEFSAQITKNVSSPIMIEKKGGVITLSKCTDGDSLDKIDFQFKIRVSVTDRKTEWWPISFVDSTGRAIDAEVKLGDRTLTNVQKQNELIQLADTWAKSISSQSLKRTIDGIV